MIHASLASIPSYLPIALGNGVVASALFWWGVISLGTFTAGDTRTVLRTIVADIALPVLFHAETILLECLPVEFFSVGALRFSFPTDVGRLEEVL